MAKEKTKKQIVDEYNHRAEQYQVFNTRLDEYYTWYRGIGDEITEFYLKANSLIFKTNHDHFRSTSNYFWVVSAKEKNVKKTHSGQPNSLVSLLVKIMGDMSYKITKFEKEEEKEDLIAKSRLDEILKKSQFKRLYKTEQMPLTLVYGDGAYFPIIDTKRSNHPLIEYYDASCVDFEFNGAILEAVIGKRYFYEGVTEYMLCERRGTTKKDDGKIVATIDYTLFKMNGNSNTVQRVEKLSAHEATKHLEEHNEYPFDFMLAVPIFYGFDKDYNRGVSIFKGRLDLADDLDQSLSQRSNTVRTSTPVEYIDSDLLDFDNQGNPIPPKRFDRRFLISKRDKNSVGQTNKKVESSQPQLNFTEYSSEALETLMNFISGIVSPATLGLELARNTNQLALREKEKVTMQTRDDIIEMEMDALSSLFEMLLKLDDYMNNPDGNVARLYDVTINYPEYASPTFEARLEALLPAFQAGMISPEATVDELWGESLGEEDKKREIEWMKANFSKAVQINDIDPFSFEGE